MWRADPPEQRWDWDLSIKEARSVAPYTPQRSHWPDADDAQQLHCWPVDANILPEANDAFSMLNLTYLPPCRINVEKEGLELEEQISTVQYLA